MCCPHSSYRHHRSLLLYTFLSIYLHHSSMFFSKSTIIPLFQLTYIQRGPRLKAARIELIQSLDKRTSYLGVRHLGKYPAYIHLKRITYHTPSPSFYTILVDSQALHCETRGTAHLKVRNKAKLRSDHKAKALDTRSLHTYVSLRLSS